MRNVFVKFITKEAERDKNLIVLTGDLGFRVFEEFEEKYPKQLINAGNAEANMVGVAAGLALANKRVCVYSIVPFVTMRCYEQIRNDVCQPNLNVNFIGVGGGFNYGLQGFSHNVIEDLAIMRTLPNMTVLCPSDRVEAELAVRAAFRSKKPAYLSLGKAGARQIYLNRPKFRLGRGILVRSGGDLTLVSTGNIIEDVMAVADKLERQNLKTRIISMPCLKPFDRKIVEKAAQETGAIFTIEEHSKIGGLGSALAETLLESDCSDIVFRRFAVPDKYCWQAGSQEYLRRINGLSIQRITKDILKIIHAYR